MRESYSQRAAYALNPAGSRLLQLMDEKQTNLAVAADVTEVAALFRLAKAVGPEICLLKTHIDILEDFTPEVIHQLRALAEREGFMLFEDRKFADIGETVQRQYRGGVYHIAEWADLTNAHLVAGPGLVEGLKEVGLPLGRGLLLLAEMSSEGALTDEKYAAEALSWARQHADFVVGFITTHRLTEDPAWIHMTPGVHLGRRTDRLGQRYLTPEEVILERRSDLLIVGRGILSATDPAEEAARYRAAGWSAYQASLNTKLKI